MTLQQLDDVLKMWQGRLSAMAENLLELQTDASYQSLAGEGGLAKAGVSGATAAQVGPALRSVRRLFQDYGALQSTVEQAAVLRQSLPALFGGDAKVREIQQLLFSASIVLESDDVPLADRALLSEASRDERCTPEQLIEAMARRFAEVRDAIGGAAGAWNEFAAAADRAEEELARLRSQHALPSALLMPALDGIEGSIVSARATAETDPISALVALRGHTDPALAELSARVHAAEQMRGKLRVAGARMAELRRMQTVASAALLDRKEKVVTHGPPLATTAEARLQAVGDWLQRLDAKCEEGALTAVGVGLRNWMTAAESCLAENQRVFERCREDLAQREELRGRMRVLKAKAQASAAAPGDEALAGLQSEAERLLAAHPVDLQAAAAAVAHLENRLRTGAPATVTGQRIAPR